MGRFSNGPVYAEYLPNLLGITGKFTDLAVGGAYSGPLNETIGVVPVTGTNLNATLSSPASPKNGLLPFGYDTSVQGQITRFLASGNKLDSNGLYIVWGGANDYLTMAGTIGAQPNLSTTQIQGLVGTQVAITVGNLTKDVAALAQAGARSIIVPILPNLGATPALNMAANSAQLGALTAGAHDVALASSMGQLGRSLGVNIYLVDVAGIFNDIAANPAKYGVSNVTTACLGATSVCANPAANLFWDSVHPTAGIHVQLAQIVASVVTAPQVIGAQGKLAEIATQSIFDGVSSRVAALQQGASGFTVNGPGGGSHMDSNKPTSLYINGSYGAGSRKDQLNEGGFHYTNGVVQGGADVRAGDQLAFGGQFGFASTSGKLKDGLGDDDVRSYSIAVYGATFGDHWYGSLAGFYAFQDWDKLNRNTYVANQVAKGTSSGSSIGAKVEGGYLFNSDGFNFGPAGEFRMSRLGINSYNENGAVALNQTVDNQSYSSLISQIGGQISTDIGSGGAIFRPSLNIGWDHQFSPHQRTVHSRLTSLPEASIDTVLPGGGEDWARIGVGLNVKTGQALSIIANLDGTVGRSDGQDYSGMVKILYQF
jgi:outer membrane lipase/esterase